MKPEVVFKMSQDIVADALNMIMNAKRAGKTSVEITKFSKLLMNILDIAKTHGYIKEAKIEDKGEGSGSSVLKIEINKLNKCNSIKPRYYVDKDGIDKYVRRYLPARDFGIIIISTNQGLMTQNEAYEKNIGGSLIAYFY